MSFDNEKQLWGERRTTFDQLLETMNSRRRRILLCILPFAICLIFLLHLWLRDPDSFAFYRFQAPLNSSSSSSSASLYWDDASPGSVRPPQTTDEDKYEDRLISLGSSDPIEGSAVKTDELKYAVFLPTYKDHIPLAMKLFQSLKCLCTDHDQVDFYAIVSNVGELWDFQQALKKLEPCGGWFGRWNVSSHVVTSPKIRVINLYEMLPPALLNLTRGTLSEIDTSALLDERDKYQYQSIKKLLSAMTLDYDWGLWLDSESIAVQPFSIRELFDVYVKTPSVFRSRMSQNDGGMRDRMTNTARTLGRSLQSFGNDYWGLESVNWIVEKAVITDMVRYVEHAHAMNFWEAWTKFGGPFEIHLYNMHIHARKLESTSALFSKFSVLESERELIRFGMAPAFPKMENRPSTGFLERGWYLLEDTEIQSNFSAFLRRYGQRLFRMEDLDFAPPEVIDRFLIDTPISMLVSGAPELHEWWEKRMEKGELQVK